MVTSLSQLKDRETVVAIKVANVILEGNLCVPAQAQGIVLFIHGSGSSRHSPRNKFVASVLNQANLATLLFDLLTPKEESIDVQTAHLRFDIGLLARRVIEVTNYLSQQSTTSALRLGYFGASTGAAAALVAASELPNQVAAVVSRGGRPDLAGLRLGRVMAPTLLIVGDKDRTVLQLNREALELLPCEKHLSIVPGASHLFEEAGTLEIASDLASNWFAKYLL